MIKKKSLKLAAIGDLHCTKSSQGKLQALFQQVTQSGADILLLCGDLVDYGQLDEAAVLAKELAPISIPMLGVFGNHEYESGQQEEVRRILHEAGVTILDGDAIEVHGIGFVGAKGFGGGFASSMPPKLLSKQLTLEDLDSGDLAQLYHNLRRVLQSRPNWHTITLHDPRGQPSA